MIEKLEVCPVCDEPLTQGGYDFQTCGTHFVNGKVRNHRKMAPVLPAEKPRTQQFSHLWIEAATLLGWIYSPAHNGYVNSVYIEMTSQKSLPAWSDFIVASDAEAACHISGVETLRQATAVLEEAKTL